MKLNTDRIVSLSAMVVGVGSLFAVIYQTQLTRRAQHASVLPYLMITLNSNERGVYVTLKNDGVGPALIQDVRVAYQGREIKADPFEFYTSVRSDSGALDVNTIMPGRLIPAGTTVEMLGIAGRSDRTRLFLGDLLHRFEIAEVPRSWYAASGAAGTARAVIEITYANVYGDRWRIRSDRIVPEPL